jgi:CO/xanthine dehydrogenase FAD-binding subunit
MLLRADELLRRIRLPRTTKNWRQYYRKVGTRKAQAISKICFAGAAQVEAGRVRDIRVALASVAPVPLRCLKTEALLKDRQLDAAVISAARAEFSREIVPIDDIRSTANYRLRVAGNVFEDFLLKLINENGDGRSA